MVEVKKELLSPCGLWCGVCSIYIAHNNNNIKFKEKLLPVYKAFAKNIDDIACTLPRMRKSTISWCKKVQQMQNAC